MESRAFLLFFHYLSAQDPIGFRAPALLQGTTSGVNFYRLYRLCSSQEYEYGGNPIKLERTGRQPDRNAVYHSAFMNRIASLSSQPISLLGTTSVATVNRTAQLLSSRLSE